MKITVTDIPDMEDIVIEDAEQLVLFCGVVGKITMFMRSNKLFTVSCLRELSAALSESMGIQSIRKNKED